MTDNEKTDQQSLNKVDVNSYRQRYILPNKTTRTNTQSTDRRVQVVTDTKQVQTYTSWIKFKNSDTI